MYMSTHREPPPMKEKKCKICNRDLNSGKLYCSHECYSEAMKGEGNHFYGRAHSEETLNIMKKKLSEKFSGEKNPFFGKSHSEEVKQAIIAKNAEYRENNKELILQQRLKRKNVSSEFIQQTWIEYKNGSYNRDFLKETTGLDYRTFHKFLCELKIATKEEIKKVGENKKLFLTSSISQPELVLKSLLEETFGKDNVKHQAKHFGFYFDFQIYDRFLVEYDGYYFHKILTNKNDSEKNMLADKNGYTLIRVEEDLNRKVNFSFEIQKIKEAILRKNEI